MSREGIAQQRHRPRAAASHEGLAIDQDIQLRSIADVAEERLVLLLYADLLDVLQRSRQRFEGVAVDAQQFERRQMAHRLGNCLELVAVQQQPLQARELADAAGQGFEPAMLQRKHLQRFERTQVLGKAGDAAASQMELAQARERAERFRQDPDGTLRIAGPQGLHRQELELREAKQLVVPAGVPCADEQPAHALGRRGHRLLEAAVGVLAQLHFSGRAVPHHIHRGALLVRLVVVPQQAVHRDPVGPQVDLAEEARAVREALLPHVEAVRRLVLQVAHAPLRGVVVVVEVKGRGAERRSDHPRRRVVGTLRVEGRRVQRLVEGDGPCLQLEGHAVVLEDDLGIRCELERALADLELVAGHPERGSGRNEQASLPVIAAAMRA